MANKNDKGEWIDPRGREIPQSYVKPLDRKRDQTVEMIVKDVARLSEIMAAKKAKQMERILKYEEFAEKNIGKRNKKGNLSLVNFSGDKRVDFKLSDVIVFDDQLQRAKTIIDDLLIEWAGESHKNLRVVITQAFDLDKQGKVNTQAILKLRSLNINNKKWKQAMDMISNSITVIGTKKYLTVSVRTENGKWKMINLNFSSL